MVFKNHFISNYNWEKKKRKTAAVTNDSDYFYSKIELKFSKWKRIDCKTSIGLCGVRIESIHLAGDIDRIISIIHSVQYVQ